MTRRDYLLRHCPFSKPDIALHFDGCSVWEAYRRDIHASETGMHLPGYYFVRESHEEKIKDAFEVLSGA